MNCALPTRRDAPAFLECSQTGEQLDPDTAHNLSPAGFPVLARYDLAHIAATQSRPEASESVPGMWRYQALLPAHREDERVSLGEVKTPLLTLNNSASRECLVKDEGVLPTGSFKARGMALAVTMARHFGLRRLALPTNGNAGAALAAYAARAGMECQIFCPADTPPINIAEARMYGATVHEVEGYIDDCGALVAELCAGGEWFNMSTLKEPYRLEGKKTMGMELAEQLGWRLPDVIIYPTGGGTGLIGMWKAFAEMRAVGWLEGPMPRMVAVQAAGCAPIVKAFSEGAVKAERWTSAATVAAGIRVPSAIGDFLILRALRETKGTALAVTDEQILKARADAAAMDGVLMCPEGAATLAAWRALRAEGWLNPEQRCVLFNCATGLKYPLHGTRS